MNEGIDYLLRFHVLKPQREQHISIEKEQKQQDQQIKPKSEEDDPNTQGFMNSSIKSKSREHAQKDIADGLKESISEYAVELIEELASNIEDGVYALCGNNEQTKEYRQKMIFLKMRVKGTRNAKARQAILGKHLGVQQLLAMGPTDFTDQFFGNLLSGKQLNESEVEGTNLAGNNNNIHPSNTIGEQKKPNVIPSVNPFQRQNQSGAVPPAPIQNNRIAGKSRYVNPNAAINATNSSQNSVPWKSQPLPEQLNHISNEPNSELLPVPASHPTDEQQQQQQSYQQQQNTLEHEPTGVNLIHPVGIDNNELNIKASQGQQNQQLSQTQLIDGNIQQQQVQPSDQIQSNLHNQTTATTNPPPPPIFVPRVPPRIGPPQPPSIVKTQPQPFRPPPNQQQQHHQGQQQQQPSSQASSLSQTPNVQSSLNTSVLANSNAVPNQENQLSQVKVPNFLSSSPPAQLASTQVQQHSQQFQQNNSITPVALDNQQPTQIVPALFSNPTKNTTTATNEIIPVNNQPPHEKTLNTQSQVSQPSAIVGITQSFVPSESKSNYDKPTNQQKSIPQDNLKPNELTNPNTNQQIHNDLSLQQQQKLKSANPNQIIDTNPSQQHVSEQLNQTKEDLLEECMRRIKLTQSESHRALTSSIEAAIEPFSKRLLAVEKMLAASSESANIPGVDHTSGVSATIQLLQDQNEQLTKEVSQLREQKMLLSSQVDELTRKNSSLSEESLKVQKLNQQITQQNQQYSVENQQLSQQNQEVIAEAQALQKELSAINEENQSLKDQLNQLQQMLQFATQQGQSYAGQIDILPTVDDQQVDPIGQLIPQIEGTEVESEEINGQNVREDIVDNVQAEDFFDSLGGTSQVDQPTHQQQQIYYTQQVQQEQQQQFQQVSGQDSLLITSSQGAPRQSNMPITPQPAGGVPNRQRRVAKGNEGMFN